MIKDLNGAGQITAEADVIVIGAGTAGLVVATALARNGISVICLESGSWKQDTDEHSLNEVVQTRSYYSGAAHGRFRCIGGTSTRWGGALIPFLPRDLEDAGWPVPHSEILDYREAVESLFDLSDGSFDLSDTSENIGTTHIARLAKWPPFKKRNVYTLLFADARAENGPEIWLNATATEFNVVGSDLKEIIALAPDGSTLSVCAHEIIFAAGAIESTRLLLLLDQQNGGCIGNQNDLLGRNFQDHLSVVAGELEVTDRKALNRLAGLRFEKNGVMRNLRYEMAEENPIREKLPPYFAHIGFEEKKGSGFDALRELFRYLQQRRLPPISTFFHLAASFPWLMRAVWWRFFERRLLFPDHAKMQVHIVIEQSPMRENRIRLSPNKVDVFGQPLAQIEWSVNSQDVENFSNAVDSFQEAWNSSGLAKIAKFIRKPKGIAEAELTLGGGIYHPCGSTRMGASAHCGVVGSHLQLFGIPNVRVVSTSILPTCGGANPTMMLMMLAFRCVSDVTKKLMVKKD